MVFASRRTQVQQRRYLLGSGSRLIAQGGVGEAVQPAVKCGSWGNGMQPITWGLVKGKKMPLTWVTKTVGVRVTIQDGINYVIR